MERDSKLAKLNSQNRVPPDRVHLFRRGRDKTRERVCTKIATTRNVHETETGREK